MSRRAAFCLALFFSSRCFFTPAYCADTLQRDICAGRSLHMLQEVRISEKLHGLPGIDNAGRISPCVYRGNQPTTDGYQALKRMGIRTVINLRAHHEERAEVERAGLKYLEFPLSMRKSVRSERLQEIVRAMSDPANQPVFIHCALGQDRTGIAVAAYRISAENWPYEDAEMEMQSFGFNDAWVHLKRSLKKFAVELEGGK